ncbi:MAG: Uma2 family endonuclease [Armatimonadota bacterium]
MALPLSEVSPPLLTYQEYLSEGEIHARYEILDGERLFLTSPTRRHQRILMNVARVLRDYEQDTGMGEVLVAPQDVLIRKEPLRTRQPDVLFISLDRLAQCAPSDDPAPLLVGPELVVEILSPSESRRSLAAKIEDYAAVGVLECWIVDPRARAVEVLQLTGSELVSSLTLGDGAVLTSPNLPGLSAAVSLFVAE